MYDTESKNQEQEFADAFADDMPPPADAPEGDVNPAAEAADTPQEEGGSTAEEDAPAPEVSNAEAEEAPAVAIIAAPVEPAEEPMDPKDKQRAASWEGRLRAREDALKAREEALAQREAALAQKGDGEASEGKAAEVLEQVAAQADDPALAQEAAQSAEAVEEGSMDPQEAMAKLAEDFGPEFVSLIQAIARAEAGKSAGSAVQEQVAQVNSAISEIVNSINDERTQAHFNKIAAAHPDYDEVANSPEFQAWVAAMPEQERADTERVMAEGTADEIVTMLSGYKQSLQAAEPEPEPEAPAADDDAIDAAEGVRSAGLKLPEQPKASNSYEDSWSDFPD